MQALAAARRALRPPLGSVDTRATLDIALLCALAGVLALQFHLVLTRGINWDEFFFYSQVVQMGRGEAIEGLNSIHVRLFAWLPLVEGSAIDRILVARQVMFAAELLTLAAISGIAAHFSDRRTGLFCALAYLSSLYVFQHGFAFRVDPLAAACGMAALWIVVAAPLNWRAVAVFAAVASLGAMVTIKLVLLAPAFVGAGVYRLLNDPRRATLLALAAMPLAGAALFVLLYFLHAPQSAANATAAAAQFGQRSAGYVFSAPTDYSRYFWVNMTRSPVLSLIVLSTPFALWQAPIGRNAKIAVLGMWSCLGVFLVYRNALPYFFPFILPPVVCAASLAVARMSARGWAGPLLFGLTANAALHWAMEPPSPIERQRQIVAAAETIFPHPVTYFDFCAMLAHYPKANHFMTAWGISGYMARGEPMFRDRMESRVVPLVLASEQQGFLTFERLLTTTGPSPHFVAEDAHALRNNYLRFWGPYWLAGKRIEAGEGRVVAEFLVPGPYTVHGGTVAVDGRTYRAGEVVSIARGNHSLEATSSSAAVLFWGDNLRRPTVPAPARPYWTDF